MADNNSPDLVASTGVNDPWSVWGSGLLQTAESLAPTALQAALGGQTPVAAPSSSAPGQSGAKGVAPAAGSSSKTYLIIAGVVVAVIAVIWFLRGK